MAAEERKLQVLRAIVEDVFEYGGADLSLRPLAEHVDASPRTLLYHFGSKESLIVAALEAQTRKGE